MFHQLGITALKITFIVNGLIGAPQAIVAATGDSTAASVDFNRQIRPLLSGHCFKCHGPDAETRKAGLRLDIESSSRVEADSGKAVILPGSLSESDLIARIRSNDPDEIMPPPATNNPLKEADIKLIEAWVKEGAVYQDHWAYVLPTQSEIPEFEDDDWSRNEIDRFVLEKIKEQGLDPSPDAEPHVLLRRLFLDLTGLPPTPEQADAFAANPTEDEYKKWVDFALNSPNYGERWARRWLDLARYADTNGYEKDRPRSIWPFRDWVIDSINEDMPFDQFTRLQIAGDMVEGADLSTRIATGFHRNTMLNEEGGIDPLEFRYYAMVDRVNTTAVTWLGLTLGCAQCHTHKYDPIQHDDYYSIMAYLNNADEPMIEAPTAKDLQERVGLLARADEMESRLAENFPAETDVNWLTPGSSTLKAESNAFAELLSDGSFLISGDRPDKDVYTWEWRPDAGQLKDNNWSTIQIETLPHDQLPSKGPGRTDHGNFVLTHVELQTLPIGSDSWEVLELSNPQADFNQNLFPPANALDPKDYTGWAISGGEDADWNLPRWIRFDLKQSIDSKQFQAVRLTMKQNYGSAHTIGRVRVSLGAVANSDLPMAERRAEKLEKEFTSWTNETSQQLVSWEQVTPVSASSGLPFLEIEPDGSVFASGDFSKRDIYSLKFDGDWSGVTAIKIEALPDERHPRNGPGSVYYEGPLGDFFLSEVTLTDSNEASLPFASASQSFASGGNTAQAAIDGDQQTGWAINGGQGRRHEAVFVLEKAKSGESPVTLDLLFEKYYAAGLGKFKVWITRSETNAKASSVPSDIAEILLRQKEQWSDSDRQLALQYYLQIAPELSGYRSEIEKLRSQALQAPTTLVFKERPEKNPRSTYVRRRGEFLDPQNQVSPGLPDFLERYVDKAPGDRLEFANWLVSKENPLTARVVMNRRWEALFGKGLVQTVEDFGYQGEAPTHPELLDWLALEFMEQKWSLREMTRKIVMSSTYRQTSRVSEKALEIDPENRWLARSPRFRLTGEMLRDSALKVSGLLTDKLGGPSVFPPQPPGVTTEGAYGRLNWAVSEGPDRYRRGLYTFMKRTAPYAMLATFDGPSGESCMASRAKTNTPLQALTLLNDNVFLEIAASMGMEWARQSADLNENVRKLFRLILVRPPSQDEVDQMIAYFKKQHERLATHLDEADSILKWDSIHVDAFLNEFKEEESREEMKVTASAWTLLVRALMNLDETVTRN